MTPARDAALLIALACSGCAALGYEIVWTRLCIPLLGSETLGVLATLAGFFGGMALGAAALHRRATRGADPIGLFVRLELGAAAFAIVSPWLLHAVGGTIPRWLGPWAGNADGGALAIAIAVAAILMLPGTFCMGATLAAVTEARRRVCEGDDDGRGVGRLYAANTAGAVLGVLVTIHAIVPVLGLAGAATSLAGLGALAAVLARRWGQAHPAVRTIRDATERAPLDTADDPDPDVAEPLPLLLVIGGAGLVGVGLEVIGVLVLSQLFENTIYTFADVLAVWLAGTAIGAWAWSRHGPRLSKGRPATALAALLLALGFAVVLAAFATQSASAMLESIAPRGSGFARHLLAEAAVAAAVFAVPTVVMGALFSHAIGLVAPRGVGRAYALNTLGGAVAPFVFGVLAPIQLGYRDAFYAVAWGYLLLLAAFTWFRRFKPVHQLSAILAVIVATAIGPRSLALVELDPQWKVVAEHETPMGRVIVSEQVASTAPAEARGVPQRRLQIGKHYRMGGGIAIAERRLGHLPLLLHGAAKRAAFLGVGTGSTLGAVVGYDALEHVDAVELVPAVLDELDEFDATNGEVRNDPRVVFHAADARRFVAASDARWDVVVADLFHPGLDGAGSLYTREHFTAIAEHLADGGLFAQWLPLYQLEPDTLASIVATFLDVFPDAEGWIGIYNAERPALALVARAPGTNPTIDTARLQATLAGPAYPSIAMVDIRDVLAGRLLDRDGLARLGGDAPRNTDLSPVVMMAAPHASYDEDPLRGAVNLSAILELRTPLPADRLDAPERERAHAEVLRFADALDYYLRGEILVVSGGDPWAPSEAAIDAYLQAYALAPELAPPRGRLYPFAARSPALAERILPAMIEAKPDEPRPWQSWIGHLRRIDDRERLAAAQAEAQTRFGSPEPLAPR